MKNYSNSVAKVIYWAGIVYIVFTVIGGLVIGYSLGELFGDFAQILGGYSSSKNEFVWTYALSCWIIGFLTSLIFFGTAEIIELLHLQKEETAKLVGAMKTNSNFNIKPEVTYTNAKSFADLPEL